MRRLNAVTDSKEPLKLVKELDAFPKIDECYVETNARSGGGNCILNCSTLLILYFFIFIHLSACSIVDSSHVILSWYHGHPTRVTIGHCIYAILSFYLFNRHR